MWANTSALLGIGWGATLAPQKKCLLELQLPARLRQKLDMAKAWSSGRRCTLRGAAESSTVESSDDTGRVRNADLPC